MDCLTFFKCARALANILKYASVCTRGIYIVSKLTLNKNKKLDIKNFLTSSPVAFLFEVTNDIMMAIHAIMSCIKIHF